MTMIGNSCGPPQPQPSPRPRDGPSTTFQVDPVMTRILSSSTTTNETDKEEEDSFGLVLVVGWPPKPDEVEEPYNEIVHAMRCCFDEHDRETNACYFYPLSSLHVTVATLHAFTLETRDANQRAVLEREWRKVVIAASQRPEWPKQPLKLEIDSCQIGSRAGILLWRETSGGIERMRYCLEQETESRRAELGEAGVNADTLRIPGIVHSSVLRFPCRINTKGKLVQERFQASVLPRLQKIFPKPVTTNSAVLVCERTPYLHHPFDDRHALEVMVLKR